MITVNQIVLFQFQKADKYKVYKYAKKAKFKINLFLAHGAYVAVYIAPKRLQDEDIFLNEAALQGYLDFIRELRNHNVKYFQTVYDKVNRQQFGYENLTMF
jgi:hypothetical protein